MAWSTLDETPTGNSKATHIADHTALHTWANAANGNASAVTLKTGNWNVAADAGGTYIVDTDTAAGIVTATLPSVAAIQASGMTLRFKRLGAFNVVINCAGSDHFDLSGITTYTLTVDDSAVMFAALPGVALTWMEFGYFGAAVGS